MEVEVDAWSRERCNRRSPSVWAESEGGTESAAEVQGLQTQATASWNKSPQGPRRFALPQGYLSVNSVEVGMRNPRDWRGFLRISKLAVAETKKL